VFAGHQGAVRDLFSVFGVATALIAAVMCFAQRNFKRLLAFSTISHMGIMLLGVAQLTPLGLAGAFVYGVGHAFAKGALFLAAGILLHRRRTVDEIDLAAKAGRMRWTGALVIAGAAALAGLPPFPTFSGEQMMGESAQAIGHAWMRWVAITGAVITAAAVFRFAGRVFLGLGPAAEESGTAGPRLPETPDTSGGHGRIPLGMSVPAFTLIGLGALIGSWSGMAPSALAAALRFVDQPGYAARVLDGLSLPVPAVPRLHVVPSDFVRSFALAIIAILVAAGALCSTRARRIFGDSPLFARPVCFLRNLHSGILPDYVAWTVAGVAILSASAWTWLR
jgi:multicomponent Na+:H+ antiporter subunit D